MYGIYLTSTARDDEVSYLIYLTNYNNTSRLFPGTWYSNKYGAYPVRCIIDYQIKYSVLIVLGSGEREGESEGFDFGAE